MIVKIFNHLSTSKMKNIQNKQYDQSAGSMLSQKTNEDFNKQKPNPDDPNFKAKIIYTCSMHPEVQTDKPGKCPKCGMQLIEKK
jgi:hypothetical protein